MRVKLMIYYLSSQGNFSTHRSINVYDTPGAEAHISLAIVKTGRKLASPVTFTSPPIPLPKPHHGKLPPKLNLAPCKVTDPPFLVLTLRY